MSYGVYRCQYGHVLTSRDRPCRECNRLSQRASRARRRTAANRAIIVSPYEGPLWSLLRARGYLDKPRPRGPNSLGIWYRGP